MLILSIHILVSLVLSTTMIAVFVSAYKQNETKLYTPMIVSFAGVVATGASLLAVSPVGLGRFCAMMSAFTLLTFVARAYYRRQVLSVVSR